MNEPELTVDPAHPSTAFTAALCAALGRSLGDWQLTEQEPAAPPSAPALQFALTLEGAVSGRCFVAVSEADAAALSADASPAEALLAALQAAGDSATANLWGAGPISVRAQVIDTVPAGAQPVARLAAASPGRAAASLSLFYDARLLESLPQRALAPRAAGAGNLGLVMDVELQVTLRFGQRQLALRDVLDLASGSVVELDRQVDEPVELLLGGRVIARGEAVIVDGNYGIRVTEVLQPVTL